MRFFFFFKVKTIQLKVRTSYLSLSMTVAIAATSVSYMAGYVISKCRASSGPNHLGPVCNCTGSKILVNPGKSCQSVANMFKLR